MYTEKEIFEFLKAANKDLGSDEYSGDEMIPDYCKAVIIGKQLQAENKRLRKAIEDFGNNRL